MFIRPVGVTVRSAQRPAGHPLLRGLLTRAAGAVEAAAGAVPPDGPPRHTRPARAGRGPGEPPLWTEREREPEREPEPEPEPGAEPESGAGPGPGPGPEREREPVGEALPGAAPLEPALPAGLVAELTQLAALAREGLLTPQEFTTAKARLLRG